MFQQVPYHFADLRSEGCPSHVRAAMMLGNESEDTCEQLEHGRVGLSLPMQCAVQACGLCWPAVRATGVRDQEEHASQVPLY